MRALSLWLMASNSYPAANKPKASPAPSFQATEEDEHYEHNDGRDSKVTDKSKMAKGKEKAKPKVPLTERYDFDRQVGPDPRDGRTSGYPCHGRHREAPMGRGSSLDATRAGSGKYAIAAS